MGFFIANGKISRVGKNIRGCNLSFQRPRFQSARSLDDFCVAGHLGARRHWRRYALDFIGQDRRRWISGVQTALCVTQRKSPVKNRAHLQISFAAE